MSSIKGRMQKKTKKFIFRRAGEWKLLFLSQLRVGRMKIESSRSCFSKRLILLL